MQNNFQKLEGVLDETTTPEPISEGKRPFSISCNLLDRVVSSTLIREEYKVQRPVYYKSQAFQGA